MPNRITTFVVLAALIASIIALLWIRHSRRRKSRRVSKRINSAPPSTNDQKQRIFVPQNRDKSEDQFPRNPTLAEKGGLPPIEEKRIPHP